MVLGLGFGLVWFVVNEKQGKYELLNDYRIIMNVALIKMPYRNSHTIHTR